MRRYLNKAFENAAPRLAARSLRKACDSAGSEPRALDALFVCTCTGYLCPGVSSHLAEQIGIRSDAFLNDMTGLGCGAALPTMHAASCFLAAHPEATVATVAVEICSAAFYLDDDVGVIVSACLFGDGASAALWRSADAGRPVEGFKLPLFASSRGARKDSLCQRGRKTEKSASSRGAAGRGRVCRDAFLGVQQETRSSDRTPGGTRCHRGDRRAAAGLPTCRNARGVPQIWQFEQPFGSLRVGGAPVEGERRQALMAYYVRRRIHRLLLRIGKGRRKRKN